MRTSELPKSGFKRVESFALVKSFDIQSDEVVIDPMCGKGYFLDRGSNNDLAKGEVLWYGYFQ